MSSCFGNKKNQEKAYLNRNKAGYFCKNLQRNSRGLNTLKLIQKTYLELTHIWTKSFPATSSLEQAKEHRGLVSINKATGKNVSKYQWNTRSTPTQILDIDINFTNKKLG